MKHLLFISLLLVLSSRFSFSQCRIGDVPGECSSSLGDYKFIKTFEIDKAYFKGNNVKNSKKEFSYVFIKGTNYKLTICNTKGSDKLVIDIYDSNRKLLVSSYDKKNKKYYSTIGLTSASTGICYLRYTYNTNVPPKYCALSILGVKGK
ncbi:MAG: hypothetical protein IIA88_00645 [Bacteroidetes bacterium]|nr:hypothetical protein [Bacteroidota bacterium]